MKTQATNFKLLLLLGAVLFLSACGASKSTTDEYANSSRLDTATVTANQNNSSRPLAACNQRSNTQLSIALAIYKSGEVIANNKIYAKILKIPSYFSQSQNYIEFHKWMMNGAGSKIWGSSKMYFNIYSISTGELLSENKSLVKKADVRNEGNISPLIR